MKLDGKPSMDDGRLVGPEWKQKAGKAKQYYRLSCGTIRLNGIDPSKM